MIWKLLASLISFALQRYNNVFAIELQTYPTYLIDAVVGLIENRKGSPLS
jgi:hypothetical protein